LLSLGRNGARSALEVRLKSLFEIAESLPHLFERGWGIGNLLVMSLLAGRWAYGCLPEAPQ
jgi:hypothetical protein